MSSALKVHRFIKWGHILPPWDDWLCPQCSLWATKSFVWWTQPTPTNGSHNSHAPKSVYGPCASERCVVLSCVFVIPWFTTTALHVLFRACSRACGFPGYIKRWRYTCMHSQFACWRVAAVLNHEWWQKVSNHSMSLSLLNYAVFSGGFDDKPPITKDVRHECKHQLQEFVNSCPKHKLAADILKYTGRFIPSYSLACAVFYISLSSLCSNIRGWWKPLPIVNLFRKGLYLQRKEVQVYLGWGWYQSITPRNIL